LEWFVETIERKRRHENAVNCKLLLREPSRGAYPALTRQEQRCECSQLHIGGQAERRIEDLPRPAKNSRSSKNITTENPGNCAQETRRQCREISIVAVPTARRDGRYEAYLGEKGGVLCKSTTLMLLAS
jgi:hypothetical protein